jgi:adenine C2-methylase RlmN of 23S rRNA A2503 and tRNA A37
MSRYHISKTNRRLSFEWALIANETDTPQAAHDLGRLISGVQGVSKLDAICI